MAVGVGSIVLALFIPWLGFQAWQALYNIFLHPLRRVPGPRFGAASLWYKAYQEVILGRCWIDVLDELHKLYGEVIRVRPNELHFSNPKSYHEIYNNANRWDKEEALYHSFGEDHSSFGFLTYKEAKARKDVLAPLFSRRAICDLQSLVQKNMDQLCVALAEENVKGKSSDMLFALRCYTLNTIMAYCFAQDVKATEAPEFKAPIVVAMDASLPGFVLCRHFELLRRMVFGMPGWLTRLSNPALAGLVDLQELLGAQVTEVIRKPSILDDAPHSIIYHRLLDPELNKAAGVPSPESLYEEAQALLFGGAESAGNTTMVGVFHVLNNPEIYSKLKSEVLDAWGPDLLQGPSFEQLEKLPYLTAVIKESLRIAPGVVSPHPRVVPPSGATIADQPIPAGTIVGMSPIFVHYNDTYFPDPTAFSPERWLQPNSPELEKWLVAFSRGPRACLGQSLGMCELYIGFASLIRRFDMRLDGTKEEDLMWRECFLPAFTGRHMRAFCKPAVE